MSTDNWHLSKSVPLTLIFGLFVQGAAIVWTVSTMTSDIEVNASKIDENIKSIRMLVEKMADK